MIAPNQIICIICSPTATSFVVWGSQDQESKEADKDDVLHAEKFKLKSVFS